MSAGLPLRWFAALLLALGLAGCEQPVPASHEAYVGHWRGEGMLLVIQPNGHGDYERVQGRQRTSIEGPVHAFADGSFKIGIGMLSAEFKVQSPPQLVEGRWRMTVDEVELVRIDILPVEPGQDTLPVERDDRESLRL